MRTRIAENSDVPALKALWKQAFGDEDEFIDAFFSDMFRTEGCALIEDDGKLVSMAHLIPCTLVNRTLEGTEKFPILYLYGMAADEAYRGKGFGIMLLSFMKGYAGAMGFEAIAALPANEDLFMFYAKAGYERFFEPQKKVDAVCWIEYTNSFIKFQKKIDQMYGQDSFCTDIHEISGYKAMLRRISNRLPYDIKGYMGLALE